MLAESAITLAVRSGQPGGFWTPASALGAALRDRLIAHAGLTFTLVE